MSRKLPILDRAIAVLSPGWALRRMRDRAVLDQALLSYRGAIPSRMSQPSGPGYSQTGVRPLANGQLLSMRDRSITLDQDNPFARAILDRGVDMAIGEGTQIQATTSAAGEASKDWNKKAEDLWAGYWLKPEVSGRFSGGQTERMVYRSADREGDIGTGLLGDGRIQLIPGGLIKSKPGIDPFTISDGVEFLPGDIPVRYHVEQVSAGGRRNFIAFDAADFILTGNFVDITQMRGEPIFSQVFEKFDQLDGYVDAKVIAQRMAAVFGLIIKSMNPGSQINGLGTAPTAAGQQKPIMDAEPGMVKYLNFNEDITTVQGQQDISTMGEVVRTICRIVGSPACVPAELALLDFGPMNLSSARIVMAMAYHRAKARRAIFHANWLSRIYRWRISKWIKAGELKAVPDAWNHRLVPYPLPLMDPKTEIEAAGLACDFGFESRTGAVMRLFGTDFTDDLLPVLVREAKAILEASLKFEKSAGTRSEIISTSTAPTSKAA